MHPTVASAVMIAEFTRLVLGLLIATFHRPIADYMLEQERSLVVLFRERGVALPAVPSTQTVRTLYFYIGIFLALLEIFRIWLTLR